MQVDPAESAPSEDTTSICNWQVSAAMLCAGDQFYCPWTDNSAVAHQSEYSVYFTVGGVIIMGSGLEEAILALLSRYLNHYKQPGDI